MGKILVVDDEQKMVTLLTSALKYREHDVTGVAEGQAALDRVDAEAYDLVLTDLRMEPVDGMAVIAGVKDRSPETQVIVLTAYGEVATAVAAMKLGACDYLTKPVNFDEVALAVERALGEQTLQRENRLLKRTVTALAPTPGLVGDDPATVALRELIAKVAPTDATVLVRGESGAGKEVVARAIHAASGRADAPFVAVNCAAIAETLLESELFGHRKGAFTGADRDREGLFESAHGGTLLLDEIGEAGPGVQAKLLRVLEERRLVRVGDTREREVDVRVIAATNRPLEEAIRAGDFREDLFYRLAVFPVDIPPLRERPADLPAIASHFLGRHGRERTDLPTATVARLRAYGWPGNVRELRNVIERAHILAGDGPIGDEHIVLTTGPTGTADAGIDPSDLNLDNHARRLIRAAIKRASGNKTLAAEMLGITRRTLYSRLKLLGLAEEFGVAGEDE